MTLAAPLTMLVGIVVVTLALTATAAGRRLGARRMARGVGLDLPGPLADAVAERTARRSRGLGLGAAAGLLAWPLLLALPTRPEDSSGILVVAAAVVCGSAVAVALTAGRTAPSVPDGPRTARASAVEVGDYLALGGLVALGLFERAARRLLDRGHPAGSTAEVVWDDAIRATLLRGMVSAPLCLGA